MYIYIYICIYYTHMYLFKFDIMYIYVYISVLTLYKSCLKSLPSSCKVFHALCKMLGCLHAGGLDLLGFRRFCGALH